MILILKTFFVQALNSKLGITITC